MGSRVRSRALPTREQSLCADPKIGGFISKKHVPTASPYNEFSPIGILEIFYETERTCYLSRSVTFPGVQLPKHAPQFQQLTVSLDCAQWFNSVLSCTVHAHAGMRT